MIGGPQTVDDYFHCLKGLIDSSLFYKEASAQHFLHQIIMVPCICNGI